MISRNRILAICHVKTHSIKKRGGKKIKIDVTESFKERKFHLAFIKTPGILIFIFKNRQIISLVIFSRY